MATFLASGPSYALPGVPVVQQPRAGLDSGDSSLATEILPGPPSLATVQQAAIRRDPRKPTPLISYLPQHDPGTTYSGALSGPAMGSLDALPEVDGPRRKRARVETAHHTQRHSARALNTSSPSLEAIVMEDSVALDCLDVPETDPLATTFESDGADASRSNSVVLVDGPASDGRIARPSRRDNRKGKQKAEAIGNKGAVRVKEEAPVVSLHFGEPTSVMRNEDHCSACRSLGSLVYCDGCTRAYHLLCLDPPMDAIDVPEDENRWFCPSCDIRRNPQPKTPQSILSPLIQHIQNTPPTEFQLPDDIRTFYKHVGSNARGAYVDTSYFKPPRLNRLGQLEDRDPYRTRDRNGAPVLCFHCGSSAIPESSTVIAPASKRPRRSLASRTEDVEQWKSIVSCDYCSAHWHLDCLDPPLASMPPFDKKWMCPNHVDNTLRPRHRIPRQTAPTLEVTRIGAVNNGNIEVSEPQGSFTVENVQVDEVFINGRRYRVPERIIKLDFWNKVNNVGLSDDSYPIAASAMSSPLTSLSSLEDVEMHPSTSISLPSSLEVDDLRLALLLLDMRKATAGTPAPKRSATTKQTIRSGQAAGPLARPQPQTMEAMGAASNASVSQLGDVKVESDGMKPERKQPARASKREVKYVVSTLDGVDSDEGFISNVADGQGATETNGHAGPSRPRKPGRPRQTGKHRVSTPKPTRSTKETKIRAIARPLDNSARLEADPAPVAATWPRTNGTQGDGEKLSVVKPVQSPIQNATPSLKIRLPRLSGLNLTPTSAAKTTAPESPTPGPKSVGSRPRRSLRRPNSGAGSSSTSVSRLDAESKGTSPE